MYVLEINNSIREDLNPLHGFFNSPKNDVEAKNQCCVRITDLKTKMSTNINIVSYKLIKVSEDLFGTKEVVISSN